MIVLADRFVQTDLARVVELYRAAGAAAPDDLDVANNEGLFCRDHAERISRSDAKAANELFEASYAAYTRAVRLDPENPRLLNDCAVILVHYLERDADLAQSMLEKAIQLGEKTLAVDPPADSAELRNLQEAVGDAYGNLGRLWFRIKQDLPKARANYQKSLEFYPFVQREATRALPQIDAAEKKGSDGK